MLKKEELLCTEKGCRVTAYVEEKTSRRGGKIVRETNALSCSGMTKCPRTTFCRFVNPLTTRNPLDLASLQEQLPKAAGAQ